MIKILFVIPSLQNGGTVSTLKNTLPYVDRDKCKIDIFPITNSGPNYQELAKYANILGTYLDESTQIKRSFVDRIKSCLFKIVKITKKVLCLIGFDISSLIFKKVVSSLQSNEYDEVIAFQEGQPTRFVQFFRNVRKIAWVHCDYSKIDIKARSIDKKENVYQTYDRIICVSDYTKNQFIKEYPWLSDKVFGIHNLISSDAIKQKSVIRIDDPLWDMDGVLKLVSIGRLHPVKGFSKIPHIAYLLRENKLKFCWFIIGGDDSDRINIDNNINEFKVQDCVKLLGNRNNPYPYIKEADALICTSLSEACPNVLNEAKILGTPIVSTNFGSVTEMMSEGIEGLITPIEMMDEAILRLFTKAGLYQEIKKNLACYHYNNKVIIEKLMTETSIVLNSEKVVLS